MICPTCHAAVADLVRLTTARTMFIRDECVDCNTKRTQPYRILQAFCRDAGEGTFTPVRTHERGSRAERNRAAHRRRQPRFLARLGLFALKKKEYTRRVVQSAGARG